MPARYVDYLPGLPRFAHASHQKDGRTSTQPVPTQVQQHHVTPDPPPVIELVPFETEPDAMGLYRVYPSRPTLYPCTGIALDTLCDAPTLDAERDPDEASSGLNPALPPPLAITPENLYEAFSSPTAGLIFCWQFSGTNSKSSAEVKRLFHTFLDDDEYRREDARQYNDIREKKLVEDYLKDHTNPFHATHGWKESSVRIRLPKEKMKWPSEVDAPEIEIKGVRHRSLTEIITSVFKDSVASTFHMTPFHQMWQVSEQRSIKIFSEAYTSPAMIEAYHEVNALPREPDDDLERVVASLMMWSDSTHLTSFGDASLWPFYLFFGNQSKYTRGKPTASACHHVAYIPSV